MCPISFNVTTNDDLFAGDIESSFQQAFGQQNGAKNGDEDEYPPIELTTCPYEENSMEEKRQKLIQELIATEETFVADLDLTVSVFKEPLFHKKALSAKEVETIFVNWDQLLAINKKFLKGLKRRKRESIDSIDSIGDIIAHNLSKMELAYITFCSRQLTAAKLIQKKTEEKGYFVQVVRQCVQGGLTNNMSLSSYLLKPTQRITKYPLLVQKIADCTPEDHEDYANIRSAVDWAQYLCNRIDEGTRLHENAERLDWVETHVQLEPMQHRLRFNSETNFLGMREVLHVGSLTKVNSKELVGFLFTDFLLLALPTKEIGKVSNFFMSDKAMNSNYKIYRRPYFLDQIEMITQSQPQLSANNHGGNNSSSSASSSPSIESQLNSDPAVFAVKFKLDKKVSFFRAISTNDRTNWFNKLLAATRVYCDSQKSKVLLNSGKVGSSVDTSAAASRLLVTVLEGVQFPSANYGLNAFFLASCGPANTSHADHERVERVEEVRGEWSASSSSNETTSGDFSNSSNQKLYVARFNHSMKFYVKGNDGRDIEPDESLLISCFDRNPFAPDGEFNIQ